MKTYKCYGCGKELFKPRRYVFSVKGLQPCTTCGAKQGVLSGTLLARGHDLPQIIQFFLSIVFLVLPLFVIVYFIVLSVLAFF